MKQKPRSFIALLLTAVLAAVLLCGCHAGTVKRSDDTSGTVPLPTAGSGSEKTTAPKADTASSERTDRPNNRLFCRSRKAHCCKGNNRFCPNESVCGVGEGSRKHDDRARRHRHRPKAARPPHLRLAPSALRRSVPFGIGCTHRPIPRRICH